MPIDYRPTPPDSQQVRLRVMDEQVDLTRWTSYSFSSNFLTPSDGWSMTIGDGELQERQRNALRVGARVRMFVDEFPLCEGYIDRIEIRADRGSGTVYSIHGRDRLGLVVDSIADPRLQFKDGTTLEEFVETVLEPFGFTEFVLDNRANRDVKTGGLRGTPTTKSRQGGEPRRTKRKPSGGVKPLNSFVLYQLKPHNHEGLYRFMMRVVERHGLFVRVSADGEQIIVAAPDFTQEPSYQIKRSAKGGTNVLSGEVVFDATDQPSVIIADGFSGGGEFGRGKIKAYCVNPYFGVDEQGFISDPVLAILKKYPEAAPVLFVTQPFDRQASARIPPRPMFLHDDESKTQEQLNWFLKRTMSELLRKSLVCHYTVEGHGQTVGGDFIPWDIDTVVDVQDEVAGVNERMYVLGRTFDKSRNGGTTTKLELIRLYSIATPDAAKPDDAKQPGRTKNTATPSQINAGAQRNSRPI